MSSMPAGYDAWKTDSGYDGPPEDECFHEDYEIGWDGWATCDRCCERWLATEDEIRCQRERIAAYDAYMRREERLDPLWRLWFRVLAKVWFWRRKSEPVHDDLPF